MVVPVQMPALGESVTEGTVTRWLKNVGEAVEVDEPLLEVSTDKVDTEITSPATGVLSTIIAAENDVVAVGGDLALIGEAGGTSTPEFSRRAPEPPSEAMTSASAKTIRTAAPPAANSAATTNASRYMAPLVRRLAADHGIDLAEVDGTGLHGRIRKIDVLTAATRQKAHPVAPAAPRAPAPALPSVPLRGTTQKATRIRQLTANKTRESLQTTAQLTQTHEVDLTRIVALRAKAKQSFAEREGVNLTYLPFFAVAVVEALKAHPNINASYREDTKEITYHDAEHLGIAVDTEQGLLSPVVHNAGDLSLAGLARAIADLAGRARSGDLNADELSGGTFTITNIGSQGALFDTPILVPPQAAMLGTGGIVKRPRVLVDKDGNDTIGVRSVAYLPLTYDHRLVDGADAGRFLTTIKRRLEEGAFEDALGL